MFGEEKNPSFFGGIPLLFKKKQGLEGQGWHRSSNAEQKHNARALSNLYPTAPGEIFVGAPDLGSAEGGLTPICSAFPPICSALRSFGNTPICSGLFPFAPFSSGLFRPVFRQMRTNQRNPFLPTPLQIPDYYIFSFSLTTPHPPRKPPARPTPKSLSFSAPFRLSFGSVSGPFRVCFGSVSGPFRGVGWGRGSGRGASVREKNFTTLTIT